MDIIELIKVIIIGIVEGITEWLPISSTGHMLLVDEFIHMNVTPEFREMFLYVIQLGAILAVTDPVLEQNVAVSEQKEKRQRYKKRDVCSLVQGRHCLHSGLCRVSAA